jgi:ankyrin repeat protein
VAPPVDGHFGLDRNGTTALMFAIGFKHFDIAQVLLDKFGRLIALLLRSSFNSMLKI